MSSQEILKKTFVCSLVLFAVATLPFSIRAAQSLAAKYKLTGTIGVAGNEGWDYVAVDNAARRVYVSHSSHVVVLDADTDRVVGTIPDTQGVHGIAIADNLGKGFTSNGRTNTATVFDLKTLKTLGSVETGKNPDAIVYEPLSGRVFTLNGQSQDATAINGTDGSVAGTLPLGGKPEFAVADGRGKIFVNIEDKSELVEFDAQKLAVLHRWPLAPCEEPTGLAADTKTRRLFVGCSNKLLAVVNADTGKVVVTLPIGDGVDATAFDSGKNLAFASTGDGNLTVVQEESADKYAVAANVTTKKSARTMGLDPGTHKIFLPSAEFEAPAPGERRGKMKAGTFAILVVSPQ